MEDTQTQTQTQTDSTDATIRNLLATMLKLEKSLEGAHAKTNQTNHHLMLIDSFLRLHFKNY